MKRRVLSLFSVRDMLNEICGYTHVKTVSESIVFRDYLTSDGWRTVIEGDCVSEFVAVDEIHGLSKITIV